MASLDACAALLCWDLVMVRRFGHASQRTGLRCAAAGAAGAAAAVQGGAAAAGAGGGGGAQGGAGEGPGCPLEGRLGGWTNLKHSRCLWRHGLRKGPQRSAVGGLWALQIICATLTGVGARHLEKLSFDVVVIDEAAQVRQRHGPCTANTLAGSPAVAASGQLAWPTDRSAIIAFGKADFAVMCGWASCPCAASGGRP